MAELRASGQSNACSARLVLPDGISHHSPAARYYHRHSRARAEHEPSAEPSVLSSCYTTVEDYYRTSGHCDTMTTLNLARNVVTVATPGPSLNRLSATKQLRFIQPRCSLVHSKGLEEWRFGNLYENRFWAIPRCSMSKTSSPNISFLNIAPTALQCGVEERSRRENTEGLVQTGLGSFKHVQIQTKSGPNLNFLKKTPIALRFRFFERSQQQAKLLRM